MTRLALVLLGTWLGTSIPFPAQCAAAERGRAPSDPAWDLSVPVLKLACASRVSEGTDGGTEAELDRALDVLMHREGTAADEALVILMSFYLGESRDTDLWENVVSRGPRILGLLKMYRDHSKPLPAFKCKANIRLSSELASEALESAMSEIDPKTMPPN